jgi:hypothetical protein
VQLDLELPPNAVRARHEPQLDRLQSTMSRCARRPSLVDAAVKMVRID